MSEDSSSTSLPSEEILGPVNEPGNESPQTELRPSDLPDTDSLKAVDVCDAMLPEKSPAMPVEGEALASPQSPGAKVASLFSFYGYLDLYTIAVSCFCACLRFSDCLVLLNCGELR